MALGISVRSTARLALALVAAIILANLLSVGVATRVFQDAVVQQGQETETLVQQMMRDSDASAESGQSERALLMQARERALADMQRSTRVMVLAELTSSLFGIGLGLVLFLALKRLAMKEREVEQTVAQLEQSNANLDAFAGRVAHDLRNALAPMRLASGLLRKSQSGGAEVANVSGILDRSGLRMEQTIEALLEFSRLNSSGPGLAPTSPRSSPGQWRRSGPWPSRWR